MSGREKHSRGLVSEDIGVVAVGLAASVVYAVFEMIVSPSTDVSLYFNVVLMLAISLFAQSLINRSRRAELKLSEINQDLETLVADRTEELRLSYERLVEENQVRRLTEEQLRESENRYRIIFENTGTATVMVDERDVIVLANREFVNLTGYEMDEIVGRLTWLDFTEPGEVGDIRAFHRRRREEPDSQPNAMECVIIKKNGEQKNILLTSAVIPGTGMHLASLSDISQLKNAQEQIRYQAFYDQETGLPNKALLLDHLRMSISRRKSRGDYEFAMIVTNIDRFKMLVDSLGHDLEHELLTAFAEILKRSVRDVDTVAKLARDEFAILLDDIKDHTRAVRVVERIQRALSRSFRINGEDVFFTASFGIVGRCGNYGQAEHVLRDADVAMLNAKEMGKGQFKVFDRKMHEEAVTLLQIENDLRRAVENGEFRIHYQPIVTCDTQQLAGFEALVRWGHPQWGLVHPDSFIHVAEESGLIVEIGRLVMLEACRQIKAWHSAADENASLFMSVNLSARQFAQPDLEDQTRRILKECDLSPEHLKLEITETVVMNDPEQVILLLNRLKSLGIRIGIDDFGTGYSSLSYLQRFPVDTLKVDKSFVGGMADAGTENRKIVEVIIALAHSLGLSVIAEGVETPQQRAILSHLNCQFAQGFLFSKPMERDRVERLFLDGPRKR
jgi:Amt family ammonium transporter